MDSIVEVVVVIESAFGDTYIVSKNVVYFPNLDSFFSSFCLKVCKITETFFTNLK